MNRIEIENRLLHEFKYLSVETLEKVLDLVSLLRTDVTQGASKFHRFHRWLFMFNPFGVETNYSVSRLGTVQKR
jgi:hypothetical protein